jgi:hypothetical protein
MLRLKREAKKVTSGTGFKFAEAETQYRTEKKPLESLQLMRALFIQLTGQLNKSLELCRPVLAQGRKQLLEKKDKLDCFVKNCQIQKVGPDS